MKPMTISFKLTVKGEVGKLLSAWHDLDKSNWEIRRGKYSAFKLGAGEDTPHVVAEQEVTCPDGSVPGGLFCGKHELQFIFEVTYFSTCNKPTSETFKAVFICFYVCLFNFSTFFAIIYMH